MARVEHLHGALVALGDKADQSLVGTVLNRCSQTRRRDAHATGDFGFFGGLAMFAGMALFMYGLTSAAFWYEVKKAKSLLLEAFGAGTEINED